MERKEERNEMCQNVGDRCGLFSLNAFVFLNFFPKPNYFYNQKNVSAEIFFILIFLLVYIHFIGGFIVTYSK
jgi:hypothetical protein